MSKDLGGIITDRGYGFSVVAEGQYWCAKFFFHHLGETEKKRVILWEVDKDPSDTYAQKIRLALGQYMGRTYDFHGTVFRAETLAGELRPRLEELARYADSDMDLPGAIMLRQRIDAVFSSLSD